MANRWIDPALKLEYLEWIMTPPGQREPTTKEAMADHLGVTARTLYNWESESAFQEKLRGLKLEWGSRWYPDILNKLFDQVMNGPPAQSNGAAKILLAHIDVGDAKKDQIEFTNDMIEAISAALKAEGLDVIEQD
jgi:hypothetical protein